MKYADAIEARRLADRERAEDRIVAAFAAAMKGKLVARREHGAWSDTTPDALLERLSDEVQELADAVEGLRNADGDFQRAWAQGAVLSEAADVGNFAAMIADVCGSIPRA